jgi:hypothetical protein
MIRPFSLLCFCAFAGAGAWLYQVKHSVAMKDRELVEIRRQTEQARQRIDILRAEWALLNEPERLRQTAIRVLTLEPMQPQHFARATDIERRLPAAVAFAGAPNLFAPAPVVTTPEAPRTPAPGVMLASAAVPAPATRAAAPAPAPAANAQPTSEPATRVPEAPAPQALAAAVAQQRADQAHRAEQAARVAAAPRPAPRPAPAVEAPRPIQPGVHIAPAPARAEPLTRVTRAAAPETTVASALGGASMLGAASSLGRPMLAPPVPVSQAAAATLDTRRAALPAPAR